ncbi:UDP-N-acetylmuramoyl-L-alanyl-D-glutamate--2,6-diaminopimelate ligase, partial [Candidatus Dojkabacteria bacterium]|nr:UDP-N-acetylmuramoyl-L-alanyl-D-glutamate--2,6-diaminopimelate ligase [Candidatus Dojkabacteria bacterium]
MEKIKNLIPRSILNLRHKLSSVFFSFYYGNPSKSMTVIGVTGTDGKTTTSTLIYKILKQAGLNVGLITTISAKIGGKDYPTGFHVTSPNPSSLQKFLKDMKEEGVKYVVLETTSHGLDQHRADGIQFSFAVYTNVTHEHLDYHKTFENYLRAKLKLIDLTKPGGVAVINYDINEIFDTISEKARSHDLKVLSYGLEEGSNIYASGLEVNSRGSSFAVNIGEKQFKVKLNMPGEYNVYNSLAAIGVASQLGVHENDIAEALAEVEGVEGRWEVIQSEPFQVVVDFAHTPNALYKMLSYASQIKRKGKVIVVFGSAGKRDKSKRALMGEAAGQFADIVFLTAEDPRGESVSNINKEIAQGIIKYDKVEDKDYFSIKNRKEAIQKAVKIAQEGDIVIISGKGHEKSMNL